MSLSRLFASDAASLLPASTNRQRNQWFQLFGAWLTFVVSAGVYHVPATLLGGVCPNATQPCSLTEAFPEAGNISWLPSLFLLVKGLLALPAGAAMRRYGVRACIVFGTGLLILGTAVFASAPAFFVLPIAYILFAIAYCLSGLAPLVCFANEWFNVGKKATAIGLMLTGFAVGGVLWPAIVAAVAEANGWRTAASLLPLSALLIALPTAICVLRDGPYGGGRGGGSATIEGVELNENSSSSGGSSSDLVHVHGSRAQTPPPAAGSWWSSCIILRDASWASDPAMYHLLGMNILCLYIVNATQHLLVMYLCTEVKLSLSTAGLYASLVFGVNFCGKVLSGIALDSKHQRLVALVGCLLLAIGGALLIRPTWNTDGGIGLAPASGHLQLVLFAVTFGLGYGCTFTLIQSRAAQLYGMRPDFPSLQSCLAVGQYIGSFVGVLLTSQLRELGGSFVGPFALLPILGLVNTVLCFRVFRPSRRSRQPQQ